MINTSKGPKSPADALTMFREAKLRSGDLLGIFNQLQGYPEGGDARKHVLAHPDSYSEKLRRIAMEKSTGHPIGAKVINSLQDVRNFLFQCGLRARVMITIRKESTRRLRMLLFLNNIEIEDRDRISLLAVAMSGEWCLVPRTFSATISLTSNGEIFSTAEALFGVVEKMELLSTLLDRAKAYIAPNPLSEEIKSTLAANANLFYDRSLFLEVCEDRSFSNQKERVSELTGSSSMEDVLMLFLHNSSREEFLEYYIGRFTTALAS